MRSKVSSKGQVELPEEIRDALGLQPGAYLDVRVEGGRIILQPIPDEGSSTISGANHGQEPGDTSGDHRREGIERPREFYDRIAQHKDFREILKRLA